MMKRIHVVLHFKQRVRKKVSKNALLVFVIAFLHSLFVLDVFQFSDHDVSNTICQDVFHVVVH